MRLRFFLLLLLLSGFCLHAAIAEQAAIEPPQHDFRQVERSVEGSSRFDLIGAGKPDFTLVVSNPANEILSTAADDFARYIQVRWGERPRITTDAVPARGNLIVLASLASLKKLPAAFQAAGAQNRDLAQQAFVIQRISLPGNRTALLCLGGSPIGARYATVEILRRMIYDRRQAFVTFDRIRDEPYFTWRAVYINDSAHQANNYDPNLIYPVSTDRWPLAKWKRYIDQMAFFRYNVLQIWLVPEMFTPKALQGGGVYQYVQETLNAVARYARPRGITLCMINGINVSVDQGTLLSTITPVYKDMPIYRYLSPNTPQEKELMFKLWDYWSKALPEVGMWTLFPGDPGGCAEQGCGPKTYVDLAIQISHIIKKNNPKAIIDFCPWQFFGWGPTWPSQFRKDTARIDRGYRYLVTKIDDFPPGTIFSPNINDFTSNPPVLGGGRGGNTVEYIDAIHGKGHLVHTWTYFVTGGEGWLNHHDRVAAIIRQRAIEAKYPISGGICYTMTPSLNLLSQFACSEAYWNPHVTVDQVMQRFTEGVFGSSEQKLIDIFPSYEIGPTVGYTFAKAPAWKPDFAKIRAEMERNRAILGSLNFARPTRFDLVISARNYASELTYFADFYERMSRLGEAVAEARNLVRESPEFHSLSDAQIGMAQAKQALRQESGASREKLESAIAEIQALDVPAMKARYVAKHYQIFLDYPTAFTPKLPILVNGLFDSFGANFVESKQNQFDPPGLGE